jgi:hypothetical protein
MTATGLKRSGEYTGGTGKKKATSGEFRSHLVMLDAAKDGQQLQLLSGRRFRNEAPARSTAAYLVKLSGATKTLYCDLKMHLP